MEQGNAFKAHSEDPFEPFRGNFFFRFDRISGVWLIEPIDGEAFKFS